MVKSVTHEKKLELCPPVAPLSRISGIEMRNKGAVTSFIDDPIIVLFHFEIFRLSGMGMQKKEVAGTRVCQDFPATLSRLWFCS
jgi:hypothetical protein